MEQVRIHFNKAFQMVDNKYYFLMELELWIKNLQNHGDIEDVIYYQNDMIEALRNHVKAEQRAERAKIVEKLAKASLSECIYSDALTQVRNRAFYEDELAKEQGHNQICLQNDTDIENILLYN